jgi:hypothetical protein
MVIDQRNAGASVTPTSNGTYSVDRWLPMLSQSSKFSIQQNAGAVTPPTGYTNYLGVTSLSAYSVLSTDYFALTQRIEGFNVADLAWGTASAATITLSFWVRSSLTGTFGGSLENSASNRSYPFIYTINSANTWEQKTITIAGDQSGTWLTNSGIGIRVQFGLGVGSSNSGAAGSWSAGDYVSATGATSVVGTSGATFYITGVQLEKGSIATPFDFRSITQELQLCYRYCYRLNYGSARVGMGTWNSATSADVQYFLPVEMRAVPSLTATASGAILNYAVAWFAVTSVPTIVEASTRFIGITLTASAGAGTQGKGSTWGNGSIGDPNAYVSAEL